MLTPKARWGDSSRRLPSPGGGGSAHIERSENVRRGGVISQLGHRSKRKTVTPPRREFHSRRPRERASLVSTRPGEGENHTAILRWRTGAPAVRLSAASMI